MALPPGAASESIILLPQCGPSPGRLRASSLAHVPLSLGPGDAAARTFPPRQLTVSDSESAPPRRRRPGLSARGSLPAAQAYDSHDTVTSDSEVLTQWQASRHLEAALCRWPCHCRVQSP
jgi:hypothetical protein